jgi:hypothetical protein
MPINCSELQDLMGCLYEGKPAGVPELARLAEI